MSTGIRVAHIEDKRGKILATIIPHEHVADGIEFLTPSESSIQLGCMHRPRGYVIEPHIHLPVKRQIDTTSEVLFIRSGYLRVDFYDDYKVYVAHRYLGAGDVVLLCAGGHGFKILRDCDIVEVKQGPYVEGKDKEKFTPC